MLHANASASSPVRLVETTKPPTGEVWRSSFPAFAGAYATLFGAFGLESPFLAAFLKERGVPLGQIGLVLAAGTAVRLAVGPVLGVLADRHDATRPMLVVAAAFAGIVGSAYLDAHGFWPLLLVGMAHSVMTAPLSPFADALALAASARERVFAYGWVRGVGSGAFVVGTLASGQLVARFGLVSIIVSSCLLFFAMALPAALLPNSKGTGASAAARVGLADLASNGPFLRLLLVAGLVIGSQAMSDAYAVIQWRGVGIGAQTVSLLWAEAVLSELAVFLALGPLILDRIGPAAGATLAAMSGIVQWGALAETSSPRVLVFSQLLHGTTFALMHLAAMRLVVGMVRPGQLATAQTVYGSLCLGLASIVLTLASGILYQRFGAPSFWAMSALCLIAVPIATTLKTPREALCEQRQNNSA